MAEEAAKKATKSEKLGPTGEAVRANVRRLRDEQGISAAQLSARMGALDRRIPLVGIQRIEAGTRRVDADDLVALAVALGVSPITLLMPHGWLPDDEVQATDVTLTASALWGWFTAERPMGRGIGAAIEFYQRALPPWVWADRQEQIDAMIGEYVSVPPMRDIFRDQESNGDD